MSAPYYIHGQQRPQYIKAVIFSIAIFLLLVSSLSLSFLSAGPIVLGTEMNTNGLVEYLCLGSGCENLHDMDW